MECHNRGNPEGILSLATSEAVAESGYVEPGNPNESYLVEMITSQNGEPPAMPKDQQPLSEAEVEAIRDWIAAGAQWPQDLVLQPPHMDPANLWSLKPIERPEPPEFPDDLADWIRTPVDAFVLRTLREHDLSPSDEADRVTLIRRVYLDMLGLPPTRAEVQEFVDDRSEDAYEQLVERVLANPHYGERWATHWLDLVRFAETHGFENNSQRPPTHHYRDYVIRAFNDDKPYDKFVFEQLAGDSVGTNAATGFLVAGPHDIVLGATEAERIAKRQLDLSDMINTTGSVFLGMTVGCARCHDHKFAPISQKDYYSVQAVFAGVLHGVRPQVDPQHDEELSERITQRQRELESLERQLAAHGWRPPVNEVFNVEEFPSIRARWVRMVIEAISSGKGAALDEFEVFQTGTDRNVALVSAGTNAIATSAERVSNHERFVINGAYGDLNDWQSKEIPCTLTLELGGPVDIERIVWSRDRTQQGKGALPTKYRIEVALEGDDWQVVADSSTRLPYQVEEKPAAEPGSDDQAEEAVPKRASRELATVSTVSIQERETETAESRDKVAQVLARWREARKRLSELQDSFVYAGAFHQPGDVHVLDRGDPSSKREIVAPDTLSALGTLGLDVAAAEQKRRVEFAKSIIDDHNPLTPRVMANRIWHYHFGGGIVTSLSDFGTSAEPPSHPELLDWLACELIGGNWSIKNLHRQILFSSTYRQSNAPNAKGMSVDASCRLLWRYPMRRMEGEAIRDSVLAISGVLDRQMYGPGFEVFKPYVVFTGYEPLDKLGSETWRRMIYMRKVREEQVPLFGAFDCPDGTRSAPKRSRSTTPIQALNLFNDDFIMEQASLLAQRVEREAGSLQRDQVSRAFQLAYGRPPDRREEEVCTEFTAEHGLAALCRVVFNSNEFLFIP